MQGADLGVGDWCFELEGKYYNNSALGEGRQRES